jgi:hypothetical protein
MSYNIKIIVARYNENLEWLNPIIDNCIIYNKGNKLGLSNEIILDNVGREAETYLHYIIENYDNLPDIVIFTQGNISDHRGSNDINILINMANEAAIHNKSICFRDNCPENWNSIDENNYYLHNNYKNNERMPFGEWFKRHINPIYPYPLLLYWNAIFAVKKELILNKPIEYYKNLILEVNHHINPTEGHFFERSWFYIFS